MKAFEIIEMNKKQPFKQILRTAKKVTFSVWKNIASFKETTFNMKYLIFLFSLAATGSLLAQNSDLPADFLSKDFHSGRRQVLRDKLPPNSVAIFFANPIRNRSNDVDFYYHQDPDFFYLTGYREANAVLFVFKSPQLASNGKSYDEIVFVQPRSPKDELWTGRRLGDEGVKTQLGLNQAFANTEFKKYNVDFTKFKQVLFFDFKNDVRNDPNDSSDLYDLIEQFKAKVHYKQNEGLTVTTEPTINNIDLTSLDRIMDNIRGIKTKEEIDMIRKAVRISCAGQVEVMKAMKPGMSEMEVEGIQEFVFKKYKAEDVGYPSIVGSGHNGCILHYEENYKPSISSDELILMDIGAEYHGYTADITRTIPINGKFSPEQKQIYDLVLKAQEEAIKVCKPGTSWRMLDGIARGIINTGLADLGIIPSGATSHPYFPHGLGHHLGLDVHDRGNYDVLAEGMVITIEPGIYIPENSNCDKKWWKIAVRIEDDILITKDGYELLSSSAPRNAAEIENTMKQPSALDDFVLPDLDKKN
jgi:Xaa-Pro aminopeptidase